MESPFMRAVVSCDEALALALLGGGSAAALDAVDGTSGYTALHYAAEYGLCELARSLVAAGAALDAATKDLVLQNAVVQSGGQTPLMLAARTGEAGIARALLVAGAGARAEDWDGIDAATAAV
ncbi:hypothetical protein M885DRAFT_546154 [Pelagophyceae sp. CCMP2097]|nr:hypothetical protein M885DRAFT_546154 [Pelagophyceae sp. CCMP2097]|mmetsp:Transcript_6250/g.22168  ORF Transcript_6250/g.22168 Transcript_6250/m.22168 type:complete len:123 (+) Transcript_6250:133-501(+)